MNLKETIHSTDVYSLRMFNWRNDNVDLRQCNIFIFFITFAIDCETTS